MNDADRTRFDALLADALESLPPAIREVLDELPLIVDDVPDAELLPQLRSQGLLEDPETDSLIDQARAERGQEPPPERSPESSGPMGLHSGVAITERSVEASGVIPAQIHMFREAIVEFAGGWDRPDADDEIYEEIRITLLHEIGHHFGLDEGELEDLGMG